METPPKTKEELEEFKLDLCKRLLRSTYPEYPKGGQSCGMPPTGIKLKCEYTGFEISLQEYRSQLKNYDLGLLLYKLYLDETIKL